MKTAEEVILEIVNEYQGAKGTVIAVASTAQLTKLGLDADVPKVLDTLVKEGKLLEVEYRLPPHCGQNLSYKTKSFYLPAKTEAILRGKKGAPLCWMG
jgi:hypothetical protein